MAEKKVKTTEEEIKTTDAKADLSADLSPEANAKGEANAKAEALAKAEAATATEAEAKAGGKKAPRGRKGKQKRPVSSGRVYIQATYNNTVITITDEHGNALAQCSAGAVGFRGPKKSTPYAAGVIVKTVVEKIEGHGLKEANVFVKGVGSGREAAVRALNANGIQVLAIKDITPIPHNGPRARKPRRI